jgi:FMN reductase (NADPH)
MRTIVAVVPAAGRGQRMGADKALLDLGGRSAFERIAATCRTAGIVHLIVVRRADAAALPKVGEGITVDVVVVPGDGDMADSLRAAEHRVPADAGVLVLPVDHALVEADTVLALAHLLERPGVDVALPTFRGRPGHPVLLRREVFAGIRNAGTVLRDVVRGAASRTAAVPTANAFVHADLDRPEDLRDANAALRGEPFSTVAQMFRHRSRRSYRPDRVPMEQVERLVDAARHASTSSFIQAYAVVAVTDPAKKAEVMRLCSGQAHIGEAPVFFAVCADLHKLAAACDRHGATIQTQSFELFLQATVDAALLGQNLQLALEAEGLGACMIGAARNHPIELAALLGLPRHCFVVFGMTAGVPADDPAPRGRMPLEGILHWEHYDADRTAALLDGADDGMRDWARRVNVQNGGYAGRPVDEQKGWSERMARLWGADSGYVAARKVLVEELRRLGFGLE